MLNLGSLGRRTCTWTMQSHFFHMGWSSTWFIFLPVALPILLNLSSFFLSAPSPRPHIPRPLLVLWVENGHLWTCFLPLWMANRNWFFFVIPTPPHALSYVQWFSINTCVLNDFYHKLILFIHHKFGPTVPLQALLKYPLWDGDELALEVKRWQTL